MLESIAQLALAAVAGITSFLLTPAVQQFLTSRTMDIKTDTAKRFTTLAIAGLITDLYNGVDTGELSLQSQVTNIECRLNDLLLANGFSPKDYNPKPLVAAVLTESKLRRPLLEAIRSRKEKNECPESTSSTSPT